MAEADLEAARPAGTDAARVEELLERAWEGKQRDPAGSGRLAAEALRLAPPSHRAAALTAVAVVKWLTSDFAGARDLCVEALALSAHEERWEVRALNTLGASHQLLSEVPQALQAYERAWAKTPRTSPEAPGLLNNIATLRMESGDLAGAMASLEEALALARIEGHRGYEATALGNLGNVYTHLGLDAAALEALHEAAGMHADTGNRKSEGSVLGRIGMLYLERGAYDEALAFTRRSLAIAREVGNRIGVALMLESLGRIHLHREELDAAQAVLDEALELAQATGHRRALPAIRAWRAQVHEARGEAARALEELEAGMECARELGDPMAEARHACDLARGRLEAGDPQGALACVGPALAVAEERGLRPLLARLHEVASRACEAQGDAVGALAHHRRFHALRTEMYDLESEQRLRRLQVAHQVAHERRKAEQAQRRVEQELRALPRRVLAAQEEERRLVARELHDDIRQRLAALSMDLGLMQDPRAAALRRDVEKLSLDVHGLSRHIHPTILTDLGLVGALRSECRNRAGQAGWDMEVSCDDLPDGVSAEVALAVFRVLQEALRNAARHAQARRVRVALRVGGDALALEVADDGRGFDPDRAAGGIGLASMRERMQLCGGTLALETAPGAGTTLRARVPWRAASAT